MSRLRRTLLIATCLGGLVLLPHGSALAGQPVDPATLNPPPPPVATCMAVGNGTTGTICHVVFAVSDPEGPSGIVCGSGANSVELLTSDAGVRLGTRYYDQAANLTRRFVRQDITGTFTNPLTGASVSMAVRADWVDELRVPGDPSTATTTFRGLTRVSLPHGGTVLIDTGRSVVAPDGSIAVETGQHPFDAYFVYGDATALEPICAAVGAP